MSNVSPPPASTKQPTSPAPEDIDPAPGEKRSIPPEIAVASDGRIIMSTADLPERDLTGRETFTGVFLTPEEARAIVAHINCAASEGASRIGAKFPTR